MKNIIFIILFAGAFTSFAQKTSRETISSARGTTITLKITEQYDGSVDTVFMMIGQNYMYSRIIDNVIVKSGSAHDLYDLLNQCIMFIPEKDGSSLEYNGNTLFINGKQIAIFGSGYDDQKCILLNKAAIVKFQTDLKNYL